MKSYDDVCADATSAAESRLLEHFKLHGGDVWTIGDGCQSCRQKLEDASGLKVRAGLRLCVVCGVMTHSEAGGADTVYVVGV